jgi:hypothetical protein
MSRKYPRRRAAFPPEVIFTAVLLMGAMLACLLLNLGKAQASRLPAAGKSSRSAQPAARKKSATASTLLGSAFLNLDWLASANSIDEADNARWSLVRGTPAQARVFSPGSGVDWQTLRTLSQSGSYNLPAGNTWSFNETFGGGPGYKIASGVLAGGHCALATAFRAAAIQAGLSNQAIPHQWPIPGFPLNETVTIWWGQYDLLLHNTTGQDLSLDWELSPQGIKISIRSFNVD